MSDRAAAESTKEHTHILRVMLAVEDCVAYWRAPSEDFSRKKRGLAAFHGHWFGTKSEARVKTLMGDMALRFDAFPLGLAAIRTWQPPQTLAPWLCHFHTQLADPIYRKFTGEYLPKRINQGYANVDREAVARWVQDEWPGRWSASTCIKFGANMLSAASDAGLLKDKRDPRKLSRPRVPQLALEYLLYLLKDTAIEGGIMESAYIRSVAPDSETQRDAFRGLVNVRLEAHGEVQNFEWSYPDLATWADAQATAGSERAMQ